MRTAKAHCRLETSADGCSHPSPSYKSRARLYTRLGWHTWRSRRVTPKMGSLHTHGLAGGDELGHVRGSGMAWPRGGAGRNMIGQPRGAGVTTPGLGMMHYAPATRLRGRHPGTHLAGLPAR